MKQEQNIEQKAVLGEGFVALALAFMIIALWFFPVPIVVHLCYLLLLAYAKERAILWLRPLLTTWPRLAVCGAFGLGLIARALQLIPHDIFAELHPVTFSFLTLILVGVGLFWLCVDAAKELRRIE